VDLARPSLSDGGEVPAKIGVHKLGMSTTKRDGTAKRPGK